MTGTRPGIIFRSRPATRDTRSLHLVPRLLPRPPARNASVAELSAVRLAALAVRIIRREAMTRRALAAAPLAALLAAASVATALLRVGLEHQRDLRRVFEAERLGDAEQIERANLVHVLVGDDAR